MIGQLKENGSVTRGWLAMQFQSVTAEIADSLELAEPLGILVAEVEPQGAAAEAGLKAGDLIKSIDGDTVKDSHQFSRLLDGTPPGAVVLLGIVRDGQERSIIASVGARPVPANAPPVQPAANEETKGRDKQLGCSWPRPMPPVAKAAAPWWSESTHSGLWPAAALIPVT